jgi:hypothetical protein
MVTVVSLTLSSVNNNINGHASTFDTHKTHMFNQHLKIYSCDYYFPLIYYGCRDIRL